ncbi:hypothetical protein C8Q74DRAFT_1365501 [Fomes fomentarius]|nr:hypothetical protein C8Q74DRAFT_1365501 [Fomes fomentarius]
MSRRLTGRGVQGAKLAVLRLVARKHVPSPPRPSHDAVTSSFVFPLILDSAQPKLKNSMPDPSPYPPQQTHTPPRPNGGFTIAKGAAPPARHPPSKSVAASQHARTHTAA